MSENKEDLWPEDLFDSNHVFPIDMINKQSEIFNKRAKNILLSEVKTSKGIRNQGGKRSEALSVSLYISAPSLDNYQFALLRFSHDLLEPYPLVVTDLLQNRNYTISSAKDMEPVLKEIFSSEKNKQIIGSLMHQSKNQN